MIAMRTSEDAGDPVSVGRAAVSGDAWPEGHCGFRRPHIAHHCLIGYPALVHFCRGKRVPPDGVPVRLEDPHWLARAGVGAPW